MAKPRKRKATKPATKLKGKRPAKRSPSLRRAVTPKDDDVFIPRRSLTTPPAPAGNEYDDDEIFVARAGAPIVVQSDWTDDDAFFATFEPRAMTAGGWTETELREHGLIAKNVADVKCRYGCGGSTSNVVGVSAHRYDCPYWQREGKHRTPFD